MVCIVYTIAPRNDSRVVLDFTERWVANESIWTYTADLARLNITSGHGDVSDKTLLVFYGIDTIANIVSQIPFLRLVP